jgi:hypothetical protein
MKFKKPQPKHILYISLIMMIVILTIIWINMPSQPPPIITITNPQNGQKYVSDKTSISLIFQKFLSDEEKSQINIITDPTVSLTISWPSNKKLLATPDNPLSSNTTYTITITYKDEPIHTFSFTTQFFSTEELNSQVRQQAQDDLIFGEAYSEFLQKYPWYRSLPINKDNYIIVYDFDEKAFRIRLKIKPETPTEKNEIVNQALTDLQEIGIDTKVANYEVLESVSE